MMREVQQFFFFSIVLLLLFLPSIEAFTLRPSPSVPRARPSLRATPETVPIIINGQNIALTPALVDYIHKRIGTTLAKLSTAVRECDVVLSVHKNPKVRRRRRHISHHVYSIDPLNVLLRFPLVALSHILSL
jgi:Sigma 54 modulation protein / S30EA ribosomal protein